MSKLLDTLTAELGRPRELSTRVVNYISGTYGIDHSAIGAFLVDELPRLEDDELDLILSPVFTPQLADQAVFAELLGSDSIPREQWPALIEQLVGLPVQARLITPDGQPHSITLREVTIERYVHRLRLEAIIPGSLFELLDKNLPAADRPMLKALARRPVWERDAARDILVRYLVRAGEANSYSLSDAFQLLALAENRKPADLAVLLASIPHWQEALRQQIDVASGPKTFFSQDAQAMHGGIRDQRVLDGRMSAKEAELEFLGRLRQVLS